MGEQSRGGEPLYPVYPHGEEGGSLRESLEGITPPSMLPAHLTTPLNRPMTSRTSSLAQEKSADTAVLPADTSMSAHISDTTEYKAGDGGSAGR